jgi:signal transduction histidine kinase
MAPRRKLVIDLETLISHELRTPLQIIIGYTELLLEGEYGPLTAEQTHSLQRIARSALALRELLALRLSPRRTGS